MRFIGKTFVTLASLAAFAATSQAAVLHTAPARSGYPTFAGRKLSCAIRNLNKGLANVTIEIMDYPGAVLQAFGPVTLGPNEGTTFTDNGSGDSVSCRFTVDGSAKKWRGAALYDNGGDYTSILPAQ